MKLRKKCEFHVNKTENLIRVVTSQLRIFTLCANLCRSESDFSLPRFGMDDLFLYEITVTSASMRAVLSSLIVSAIFTARKRSLGQGNIFTPVCHSVHRGVPGLGGGAWSWVVCSWGGGLLLRVGGAWWRLPPDGYCCGRYASYWNAFLYKKGFYRFGLNFVFTFSFTSV